MPDCIMKQDHTSVCNQLHRYHYKKSPCLSCPSETASPINQTSTFSYSNAILTPRNPCYCCCVRPWMSTELTNRQSGLSGLSVTYPSKVVSPGPYPTASGTGMHSLKGYRLTTALPSHASSDATSVSVSAAALVVLMGAIQLL